VSNRWSHSHRAGLTDTPCSGYLGIPLYLIMILGYKLVMKSERVRPETADLFSGKDKIDREEEEFLAQQAAKNQNKRGGPWFYRHFVGWLF
jgi:amino acid transporter